MAETTTVKYTCDKCECDMGRPRRTLSFSIDTSDLWNPKTWGIYKKTEYHLCEECSSKFFDWLRSRE